ncbi:hypothetical protein RBG61_01345 [Paludicola sp. MB14-C6]|uniref:hypothetical protein n=1 Tax=Paludihabitans sp. MB14-C6 TaxID=3070656 RepID=UPI0027DBE213|nr:hypothetical protein [Paludicola sp. MB14-C6]WMJ23334.1 hypothetical protein RBG61_01345 [Paludicola sp. MB14-C6]
MQTIVIYGDKQDIEVKNQIIQLLKNDYNITVIEDHRIYSVGSGPSLNIILTNNYSSILITNAIIILTSNAKLSYLELIDPSCRIIVNADDANYVSRLASLNSNIYTCGFSQKDSITFSSREKDNVVVSLQRSITTISDNLCEPFEIPCEIFNEISDYTILATILVLILLNYYDEKKCLLLTKIYF